MTFAQWAATHDFFKPDTKEAFRPLWSELIGAGNTHERAAELLGAAVSAMKGEYGE